MTGPDTQDDTSADPDRFEADLLAQDRDTTVGSMADIGQDTAHRLVKDLLKTGVVHPVPEDRLLVHDPSGEAFESVIQLAIFHKGWTAASDRNEVD